MKAAIQAIAAAAMIVVGGRMRSPAPKSSKPKAA